MRLSEARLLLSRYKKKNRKKNQNGAAAASAPALAVDLKDLPPEAVAGSAEGQGSAADGAAGGVAVTATHVIEQGLMKLVEKAVMALTEVCRVGIYVFDSCSREGPLLSLLFSVKPCWLLRKVSNKYR